MANGMMTVIQYEGYQPTGPAASFMSTPEAASHHDHTLPATVTAAAEPSQATTPDRSVDAGSVEIALVDDRIDPPALSVARGTTVTWTNRGADWHSLAAYDGSFESGRLAPGETFAHRFDRPGTHQYLCKHHAMQGMIGWIAVT